MYSYYALPKCTRTESFCFHGHKQMALLFVFTHWQQDSMSYSINGDDFVENRNKHIIIGKTIRHRTRFASIFGNTHSFSLEIFINYTIYMGLMQLSICRLIKFTICVHFQLLVYHIMVNGMRICGNDNGQCYLFVFRQVSFDRQINIGQN